MSSSRRETIVVGSLTRVSVLCVDLGVGGSVITSVSHPHPTHSCDRRVCDLGVVGASSIFGWVRGTGAFDVVLPTFVLVSRIHLEQQYRDNDHFLNAASSSRHKTMVGGALAKSSTLRVGLGVSGATIVPGSCAHPSYSWISRFVDLIFISRYF